ARWRPPPAAGIVSSMETATAQLPARRAPRLLAPFVDARTYRRLAFLFLAVPVGAVAWTVLLAGWILTLVFAITPLVIPILVAFRWAVLGLGAVDAWLARALLGAPARPAPLPRRSGRGFWRSGIDVLADGSFWKAQGYL